MDANKPHWWPERTDSRWIARIRRDYPEETTGMSDETIRDEYAYGAEFVTTWDNAGDAYNDYEPVADLCLRLAAIVRKTAEHGGDSGEFGMATEDLLTQDERDAIGGFSWMEEL